MLIKRLIGLIFLVLLFIIPANAQSQLPIQSTGVLGSNEKPQAPENKKHSENDQRGTEKTPLVIKMASSPNAQEEAARAKQEKDEKAAANRRSEIITIAIAVATFLQAFALIITIFVMVRTTRKQLRAYVFIDTIDIMNIIAPPPETILPPGSWVYQPTTGPLAIIVIKNSGQTPAYGVINWGEICFREFPLTSALSYGDRNAPGIVKTKFAIPPEGKTFKNIKKPQPLSDDEIAQLRAGTHAIYVYGDIVYKDTFGKNRSSNYRYFINGFTGFTHLYNTMSGCEEGNEAD